MTQGYDRREVVKDMNAQKTRATGGVDSVPLAPVMSPQPSSFSKVGAEKRSLAEAIGSVGNILIKKQQEIEQKRVDDEYLEGQLSHTQGMAEKEAKAKGEWFGRGWLTRKADTMSNVLLQQGVSDIHTKYAKYTPTEYSRILMQNAVQAESDLGDDPYTKKLSAGIMSDILPRLVKEHVAAHNEFNKQESAISLTNQGIALARSAATGDKEMLMRLDEWRKPGTSGLPREIEIESILTAAEADTTHTIASLLLKTGDLKKASTSIKAQASYSAVASLALKDTISPDNIGTYGLNKAIYTDPPAGIVPIQDSSLQEQERVGAAYVELLDAKYDSNPFLIGLAKHDGIGKLDAVIARVGDPTEKEISMESFLGQYDGTAAKEYAANLAVEHAKYEQKPEYISGAESMLKNGWSMDQIKRLSNHQKKYLKERNSLNNAVTAIANGTVNFLKGKDKAQALGMIQNKISSDVLKDSTISPGEQQAEVLSRYITEIVKLDVVDDEIKKNVSLQLTPAHAVSKDGTVDPRIVESYKTFVQLQKKGGPAYADKYLISKDQKRFVAHALINDAGAPESAQSALYLAQLHEQSIRDGSAAKAVFTEKDRSITLQNIRDEIESSEYEIGDKLFGFFTEPKISTSLFNSLSGEVSAAMTSSTNEVLVRDIERVASALQAGGVNKKEAAIKQATTHVLSRTATVMGNVLRSGEFSTIYEDAGVKDYADVKDFFNASVAKYVAELGPKQWGSEFGGYWNSDGVWAGIKGFVRGVPTHPIVRYDPQHKNFLVNIRNEDGDLLEGTMIIDAKKIGRIGVELHHEKNGVTTPADHGMRPLVRGVKRAVGKVAHEAKDAYDMTMYYQGALLD